MPHNSVDMQHAAQTLESIATDLASVFTYSRYFIIAYLVVIHVVLER